MSEVKTNRVVDSRRRIVNVAIRPRPEERGGRWVEVDERAWATIHMTQHGSGGNKFHFRQIGGEMIMIPLERQTVTRRFRTFEVRGDKMERRYMEHDRKPGQPMVVPAPVEERLLEAAKNLIAKGLIIHPDEMEKRREAARAVMRASAARGEAAKDRKFTERARKVMEAAGVARWIGTNRGTLLITGMVEAMKWAQSQ